MAVQTGQCFTLLICYLVPAPDISATDINFGLTLSEQPRFILEESLMQSDKNNQSQKIHINAINTYQHCKQDDDDSL